MTLITSTGYVPVDDSGDTMTGPLLLSGDPIVALGAATKQYVDAGGGHAPVNGTYITQVPTATLTNEQALSALATGIMQSANGTGVVTINTSLTSMGALGTAADKMVYSTALNVWAESDITAAGRAILDDANAAAQRTTMGVAIGSDVQAYDATLAAWAGFNTDGILTQTAADTFTGRTLTGTAAEITVTNGDGVAANPTFSLPAALTFTGKTVTGGTLSGVAATTFTHTTGSIGTAVTGVTQAPADNSTKLATTAYADAAAGAGGANTALSNLAAVAINTSLISDTDVTDDLGSLAVRWNNIYAQKLSSGDTAADVLTLSAYDVDGAATENFITLTSNNTPTCVLASGVTATTQAPSDNSTKLATTAYADAAGGGGGITAAQAISFSMVT